MEEQGTETVTVLPAVPLCTGWATGAEPSSPSIEPVLTVVSVETVVSGEEVVAAAGEEVVAAAGEEVVAAAGEEVVAAAGEEVVASGVVEDGELVVELGTLKSLPPEKLLVPLQATSDEEQIAMKMIGLVIFRSMMSKPLSNGDSAIYNQLQVRMGACRPGCRLIYLSHNILMKSIFKLKQY